LGSRFNPACFFQQKPILLKGHTRAITHLTYNYDGDLIFTASKADNPTVWWADTGERIGTYAGHTGSIWYLDVTRDSKYLVTASADATARLFDVVSGKELHCFLHRAPVRSVCWAEGDKQFLTLTDQVMGKTSAMYIYSRGEDGEKRSDKPLKEIYVQDGVRINKALFGPLNEKIYASNEDGTIRIYDTETGRQISKEQVHKKDKPISRIKFSAYHAFLITASRDGTAKLVDPKTLQVVKTYDTGRPVNAADMSPIKDHVIVGGGEGAEVVTHTRLDSSQFKVRFFHTIFEYELGNVVGHFGPVNVLSFSPDGKSFASGSEDGYVRIHHFNQSYFDTKDTPDLEAEKGLLI